MLHAGAGRSRVSHRALHLAASGRPDRAHPRRRQGDHARRRSSTLTAEIRGATAGRGIDLTFFEFLTVMAFLHFARQAVDVAVRRGRSRRPARRDQRRRPDGGGDHHHRPRSRAMARRHAAGDRRREGRHHQARPPRRAGAHRAAGAGGAAAVGGGTRCGGVQCRTRLSGRDPVADRARLRGTRLAACRICRSGCAAFISTTTPARRWPRWLRSRDALPVGVEAIRAGAGDGALARTPRRRRHRTADDPRRRPQPRRGDGVGRELPALLGGRPMHLLFAVMGDKDWRPMVERLGAALRVGGGHRGAAAARCAGAQRSRRPSAPYCPVVGRARSRRSLAAHRAAGPADEAIVAAGSLFLVGALYATVCPPGCGERTTAGAASVSRRPLGARPCGRRGCAAAAFAGRRSLAARAPEARTRRAAVRATPSDRGGGDHRRRRVAQLRQEARHGLARRATSSFAAATRCCRPTRCSSTGRRTRRRRSANAVLVNPDAEIRADAMYIDLDKETGELSDARRPFRAPRLHAIRRAHREAGRTELSHRERHVHDLQLRRGRRRRGASRGTRSTSRSTATAISRAASSRCSTGQCCGSRAPPFPVFRERQSGFLIPRVGFSNRRGFQLLQPYYWAINKNQDATLSARRRDRAALGLAGEYRYAFSRATFGAVAGRLFQRIHPQPIDRGAGAARDQPDGADQPLGHDRQPHPDARIGAGLRRPAAGRRQPVLARDEQLYLRRAARAHLRTLPFTTSRSRVPAGMGSRVRAGAGRPTTRIWSDRPRPSLTPPPFSQIAGRSGRVAGHPTRARRRLFAQKQLGFG